MKNKKSINHGHRAQVAVISSPCWYFQFQLGLRDSEESLRTRRDRKLRIDPAGVGGKLGWVQIGRVNRLRFDFDEHEPAMSKLKDIEVT